MISKSNNNSYHDNTSIFFNVFSEKDLHLNAIECSKRETIAKYFENKKVNFVWYYNSLVLMKWFVVFSVLYSILYYNSLVLMKWFVVFSVLYSILFRTSKLFLIKLLTDVKVLISGFWIIPKNVHNICNILSKKNKSMWKFCRRCYLV